MVCCVRNCGYFGFFIIALLAFFVANLWPFPSTSKKLKTAEFVGPLTRNRILDSAEKLFESQIGHAPESIAIHNGGIFTGLSDGRIIEINGDKMRTVTRVGGSDCDKDKSCGHPLGIRFDKDGALVVADCVKGLYKIDIKTGAINMLVPSSTPIDGQINPFFDDLAIAKNGDIYFSDGTHSWHMGLQLWHLVQTHNPDGRILHYDAKTKQVSVVLDKLYFPNGVELSPDEEYLVFAQFLDQNIKKFYLKGPKKGQLETVIDNLPGCPDNVRITARGTYWVAMSVPRIPEEPSLWEQLSFCYITRYLTFSSIDLMKNSVDYIRKFLPHHFLDTLSHTLAECQLHSAAKPYGLVLEINNNGEILRSLHSPKGFLSFVSQATEHEGNLYLGSFCKPNLAKLKI